LSQKRQAKSASKPQAEKEKIASLGGLNSFFKPTNRYSKGKKIKF
jgi:hypothetical protein